ncbi:response regulator transcription factor [Treponema sp.]|uniref:response regulator transcription factor n=1 Tax=Treponema sp. TaxID=166 RepID=UPI003890E515
MLNESEWEEKRVALLDLYVQKDTLSKEQIERLLKAELVISGEKESVAKFISDISKKFSLSIRESEVLEELALGKSNSQISETLFVSVSTVKKHIYSIFNKVGVNSRTQLLNLVYNM